MGGGHLSRPDFGMPQPDPDHPLTEFYLLLQHGLDKAGVFHLPALYASFRAPARRIYADEAAGCLTLSETADEGAVLLSAPRNLQLLYSSLHVEPDGSPPLCCSPRSVPALSARCSSCLPLSGRTRCRPCRMSRPL